MTMIATLWLAFATVCIATILIGLAAVSTVAEEWSRARIERLPDSAFAVIEATADGRKIRHLPHHDESGAVDAAHLKAAWSRLLQVRWLDPANGELARRHLEDHRAPISSAGFAGATDRGIGGGRRGPLRFKGAPDT
jgi:hypothetical protein